MISSQLKEVFKEQGVSIHSGTASLTTGGTPITLGKKKLKPAPKFTNESINRLQLKTGNSDNKMRTIANFLRIHCGRDSVHKLDESLTERNKKLEDYFNVEKITQTKYVTEESTKNGKKQKKKSRTVTKKEETLCLCQ